MKIRTMFYLLGQGILNIFKNRLMSFAAITTISACIFVVGIFYTVGMNIEYMLDALETNLGMTVFFEEGTTQEDILDIKKMLEVRSEVYRIEYISPEEAWTRVKTKYFAGKEDQLSGFEGDNPLKDSASLEVYFSDLDSQKALSEYVLALPAVRRVDQSEGVFEVMKSINNLVRYGSLSLVAVLLIISVFLIANTVRLGISTRKKEIEIMKFIGARDGFIKGPFVIEGAVIGLIGTVIPLGVIYYFYDNVTMSISTQFTLLSKYLTFMNIMDIYQTLVPVAVAVGIVIGIIGSRMTIRRYLKV